VTWRWFTVGSRPVWIVAALLAICTWPLESALSGGGIGALATPGTGLDFSWIGGLYMAADEGKHFGTEVVWTYGPLGFLVAPQLWFSWLAVLSYIYFGALFFAFTAVLTWSVERTAGLLAAAVIVYVAGSTFGFLAYQPLLLAVGLAFAAMRADRPDRALGILVIGGGLLCAIEPLVKLSIGPPTVLIVVLGLIGARAERRQWATFAAIAVVGFFALWFAAGQGIGNLWDYGVNGIQVITGYNEAMAYATADAWEAVAIILLALGLVLFVRRARFRDALAGWMATALTLVAAYVLFKYGTTQFGKGAAPLIALAALFGIFLMVPWPRRNVAPFLVATVVIWALVAHSDPTPDSIDPVPNLEAFKRSAELAIRPGFRQGKIDQARANLRTALAVPPGILAALKGKSVAVEPWEISAAWAYELDWHPLPVIESYTAYTRKLDRLNSAAVESESGPQMLLRQWSPVGRPGFGGREAAWDPPEQTLAEVCDFVPVLTEGAWQVMTRIRDRCQKPTPAGSESARAGEPVKVPQAGPGELVYVELHGATVTGLEKLAGLFWQPGERRAVINGGEAVARLVPGTSGDPMVVSVDRSPHANVQMPELPVIHELSVEGTGDLTYDFYRVRLYPVRASSS
jgi:hypothetical protein